LIISKPKQTAAYKLWQNVIIAASRGLFATAWFLAKLDNNVEATTNENHA